MDRCRCEDYAQAVKKLRIYTVGTYRPALIDSFDRSTHAVVWMKHGVDYSDLKFSKPKAWRILKDNEKLENLLPKDCWKVQQMWCPYMTPVKI